MERFWSKVDKSGDCWEWTASCGQTGYGQFWLNNTARRAPRVAWELTRGEIPSGLHVLHTCDNRSCVNPAHLFLGTNYDNVLDKMSKGRHVAHKGELCGASKLTLEQVRYIRYSSAKARNLAEVFKVSRQNIHSIRNRNSWNGVI